MGRILIIHPQSGFLDLVKRVLAEEHQVEALQSYASAVSYLERAGVFDAVLCGVEEVQRAIQVFDKVYAVSSATRLIPVAGNEKQVTSFWERWDSRAQGKGQSLRLGKEWLRQPCTAGDILALFRGPVESPGDAAGAEAAREEPPVEMAVAAGDGNGDLAPSAVPGTLVDGYKLTCAIGQGGFGSLWLALNETTGKRVAVKCVEGEEQVGQELAALRKYVHAASRSEHLIPIEHIRCDGQYLWVVMPLADSLTGGDTAESYKALSLANLLQARGHLPEMQAVEIAVCVIRALSALHESGLLHGDVAAGNILSIRGRWVLADPGLVRFLGEPGLCRNRRYYPQPQPVHPSDDLYAVGVLLWEMASGVAEMIAGRDQLRLDARLMEVLLKSELPMVKVICRAVAENPGQRYMNAEELLWDLQTLRAMLTTQPGKESALYCLPRLRSLRTSCALPPLA